MRWDFSRTDLDRSSVEAVSDAWIAAMTVVTGARTDGMTAATGVMTAGTAAKTAGCSAVAEQPDAAG